MLIVHSTNDDNVRTKHSAMMYEAAKKAGVEIKWLWHQSDHMTPSWPPNLNATSDVHQPFSMYCGDYTYDEWLNMWFSHHLYDLDNSIMKKLPGVLALDNVKGEWIPYDSWESPNTIVLNNANLVSDSQGMAAMSRVKYEEPEDYSENYSEQDFPRFDNAKPRDEGIIMPAASVKSIFSSAADSVTVINSANGSSSWQNFLNTPTAGSTVYHFNLTENVAIKGVVKINIKAAISSVATPSGENSLNIHAKLVEIAAPSTTLKTYGRASNGTAATAMGSSPGYNLIKAGGAWQGGGMASYNLVEFIQQTTATYREIAKGWMDLNNPSAGFDSYTADRNNHLVASGDALGVYHDYCLCLQPIIHTASKGNKLALIITTGAGSAAAYTGNNAFTFTIDNDATNIVIPIANPAITIVTQPTHTTTVTEGKITGDLTVAASVNPNGPTLTYQWYSNTADTNTGGTAIPGATSTSFTIPTTLTAGTYYYFCEVSATGVQTVRSNAGTVKVNPKSGILDPDCWDLSEFGCNAFGIGALLFIIPFVLKRKS
jgi:hypothetical protein